MRSFLSYLLLITLLFPTIVESLHAISDSHNIQEEQSLNFNKEKHNCTIGLYLAIDYNSSESNSYDDLITVFLLKENLKTSTDLISSLYYNDIKYRGPPQA
tara:strand:- start:165 stop:467 length:303 start_codon:yes stop_codon:yes gene_type:complete